MTTVPNVEGDSISHATQIMAAVGLTLDSSAVYPTSIVAYTIPAAGSMAPVGSSVEEYSCAAGSQPTEATSGSWICNPGGYYANWGGQ